MNTFLGVELGIQMAERIVVMQEDLSEPLRQLGADVLWTPPHQLRVLLKDFGELLPGQKERLIDLLRAFARATHEFSFSMEAVRFDPSVETPRMLIGEIRDDSGLLEALHTNVEKAAEPLGFRQEIAEWRPWVLIGRCQTHGRRPDLRGVLNAWTGPTLGTTDARELVLFSVERVTQLRARSRVLGRFELGTGR